MARPTQDLPSWETSKGKALHSFKLLSAHPVQATKEQREGGWGLNCLPNTTPISIIV